MTQNNQIRATRLQWVLSLSPTGGLLPSLPVTGADKSTGTNSQIMRRSQPIVRASIFSTRYVVRCRDTGHTAQSALLRITNRPVSHPSFCVPQASDVFPPLVAGKLLGRAFPLSALPSLSLQSRQDSRNWQRNMHPPDFVLVGGKQTAICPLPISLQVEAPFISSFCLHLHEHQRVMERRERHGKVFGVLQNVRRTSSVRDSSKANSASGPLSVRGGEDQARVEKAWMDLQQDQGDLVPQR